MLDDFSLLVVCVACVSRRDIDGLDRLEACDRELVREDMARWVLRPAMRSASEFRCWRGAIGYRHGPEVRES